MKNLAKKIRYLRQITALTQPEFARAVGDVDQSTVSKWEQGKQKPRPEHIVRLAEMANVTPAQFMGIPLPGRAEGMPPPTVRVTGALQAGAWADSGEWPEDDQYEVPAPLPPEWLNKDIHAREVSGTSMNRYYPDGSIVYVCPISVLGRRPNNGERVVVQRVGADGTYEATLKEYVVGDDGKIWLWPRSYDPEHQTPLQYVEARRRIDHVTILGIVIASLVMESARTTA